MSAEFFLSLPRAQVPKSPRAQVPKSLSAAASGDLRGRRRPCLQNGKASYGLRGRSSKLTKSPRAASKSGLRGRPRLQPKSPIAQEPKCPSAQVPKSPSAQEAKCQKCKPRPRATSEAVGGRAFKIVRPPTASEAGALNKPRAQVPKSPRAASKSGLRGRPRLRLTFLDRGGRAHSKKVKLDPVGPVRPELQP
jgi:hypothetical protein